MIRVLGITRLTVLGSLLLFSAVLGIVSYLYVIPEGDRVERELRMIRSQVAAKRADADRLRTDFEQIQQKKERFENLEAAGFMSNQNRLMARRRIVSIQKYTKVLRAGYTIKSADIIDNKIAGDMGYLILETPIKIDIEAMDDIDLYDFIYWMENAFPGHMALSRFRMNRSLDINEATLRQIGSGVPTALVQGKLNFVWRTMVLEDEVKALDAFGSGRRSR